MQSVSQIVVAPCLLANKACTRGSVSGSIRSVNLGPAGAAIADISCPTYGMRWKIQPMLIQHDTTTTTTTLKEKSYSTVCNAMNPPIVDTTVPAPAETSQIESVLQKCRLVFWIAGHRKLRHSCRCIGCSTRAVLAQFGLWPQSPCEPRSQYRCRPQSQSGSQLVSI